MVIIGELFDHKMAQELASEMNRLGYCVELKKVETPQGDVFQIIGLDEVHIPKALDYFRVRMGLPGAPPEIDPAWLEIKSRPFGAITKFLILLSVALFLISLFSPRTYNTLCELLFFNEPNSTPYSSLESFEFWRLVTPIFLHFGWLHIIFNSMWIKDLGSYWESELGPKIYLVSLSVLAIGSNLCQYIHSSAPFGGLSGVVYGFFGMSWGHSLIDSKNSIVLPKRDIFLMVGWYFLCLSGLVGKIANVAHGVGLGLGLLFSLLVPFMEGKAHLSSQFPVSAMIKVIALGLFFCVSSFFIEGIKDAIFL